MSLFRIKSFAMIVLSVVAVFVMLGCGGGAPKSTVNNEQPERATQAEDDANAVRGKTFDAAESSEQAENGEQTVVFKSADGRALLTFKKYADHDKIEIDDNGTMRVFKGRSNKPGSFKYKEAAADNSEKQLIAEVKRKSDSFKLFDDSDKLLWKVKINEDKVKVSDNEENKNAFEIVKSSPDRCKIRDRAAIELGDVKYYPDNGKLKVKTEQNEEVIITKDSKNVVAPGVVLFSEIPLELRAIIINELLRY
ncbi:MAG: hypothetical protein WDA26_09420 [Pusillimonas sp.]